MLESDFPELGVVRIAKPCPMRWTDMDGDGRVRFCSRCSLNVFNFAEIESEEARQMLRAGGRICARLFVRADGTVLTKDCPRGYPAALRWAKRFAVPGAVAAVLAVAFFVVSAVLDQFRRLESMPCG